MFEDAVLADSRYRDKTAHGCGSVTEKKEVTHIHFVSAKVRTTGLGDSSSIWSVDW